jgi:hypothetical protein
MTKQYLSYLGLFALFSLGCGNAGGVSASDAGLPDSLLYRINCYDRGNLVLYVHSDHIAELLDLKSMKRTRMNPPLEEICIFEFGADGTQFIMSGIVDQESGMPHRRVLLYRTKDLAEQQPNDLPSNVVFIPNATEDRIAAVTRAEKPANPKAITPQCRLEVWERRKDKWSKSFIFDPAGFIQTAKFLDSDRILLKTGFDLDKYGWPGRSEYSIVDLRNRPVPPPCAPKLEMVRSFSVSDGGRFFVVGDVWRAYVYDTDRLSLRGTIDLRDVADETPCAAVSPDGRLVACASSGLIVRNIVKNKTIFEFKGHRDIIRSSLDLTKFSGDVEIERQQTKWVPLPNDLAIRFNLRISFVQFIDAGRKLVAATPAGELFVWDTETWKQVTATRLTNPRLLRTIERNVQNVITTMP